MNILRKFLQNFKINIKSIITAVISSAVIWVAVSLQLFPNIEITVFDIPVEVNPTLFMNENNLQLPDDFEITTSIRVQGQRRIVERLTGDDFKVVLDLSRVNAEGEQNVEIIVNKASSEEFEILSTEGSVKVRIEKIDTKTLEIIAKADNIKTAEGMTIDNSAISAHPSTVTIKGEKSLIDTISRAEVNAVYTDEMLSTHEVRGELVLYNRDNARVINSEITLDTESFTVTVPIHRVKTLPLDYIITRSNSNFDLQGLRNKMTITPEELTLSSPDTSIDHLAHFEVGEIRLSDITPNMLKSITHETIYPMLPEGYKNISGEARFSIQFENVDDYEPFDFPIPRENFTILNAPEGFDIEILTKELNVSVLGPSSFVQAMSVNDISVTVDLKGIEISQETESKTLSKSAHCRIEGRSVPAWVMGYPQIDISLTRDK